MPNNRPQKTDRLKIEQGGICFYCKQPWRLPTVDHVLPRRAAAPALFNKFRNKVIACYDCNFNKSDRLPTEEEIDRLFALKRRYAEANYDLNRVKAEPQTNWLQF